ncbi:FAD-dependent monooxygenase [Gordonia sp. (in: high G+C Gram-positive bacteria)]|uniref:FAD-dependent monooxygenase n=2 Tax=Gordonia sp. (in: high G+C Gram-positive bacteria) TaxID=84139 RepID=UPI003C742C04
MHVIIAGAGIAGLTAAAAFVRDGHKVTVLEQRHDTAAGAGITLWPNALAALDRIGLGEATRAVSARIEGGVIRWQDGSTIRRPAHGAMVHALGEPLAVLRRSALRDVITDALPKHTVRYGTAVTAAFTSGDGAAVVTSDGQRLPADLVVAADGTRSALANRFNPGLVHTYTGYSAWRGIADLQIDPRLAGQVVGRLSEFGEAPLREGQTYWFGTVRLPENTQFGDESSQVRALASRWPEPIAAVVAATSRDQTSRTDLYDRPLARSWSDGSVVLVGDAAHPMRPHLGQGGCQAIEDAVVLAAAIAKYADVGRSLERYEAVRKPRARKIATQSRTIGRIVGARPPVVFGNSMRASRLVPNALFLRHLATIAGKSAIEKQLSSL